MRFVGIFNTPKGLSFIFFPVSLLMSRFSLVDLNKIYHIQTFFYFFYLFILLGGNFRLIEKLRRKLEDFPYIPVPTYA